MKKTIILSSLLVVLTISACGEKQANSAPTDSPKAAEQMADASKAAAPETATQTADGGHPGKAIHDKTCLSCHDSGVYTRPDHKMTDFAMLSGQVRRCDANLGSKLFDEDMNKIADYLNEAYYKFPKP